MMIAFISITYNSPETALKFVKNIFEVSTNYKVDVVIVDNSDSDECVELQVLDKENNNMHYIKSSDNLGYFGGAKIGYEWYKKHNVEPDWVIVSNVDLTLPNSKLFEVLTNSNFSSVGVLAPNIISSISGKRLNPFFREKPTSKRISFYANLSKSWFLFTGYLMMGLVIKKILGFFEKLKINEYEVGENVRDEVIYAPHGSMIVFSRNYFEAGLDLEYEPFLFGEEIFVAESARRAQLPVLYIKDALVIHHEHVSTGLFKNKAMLKFYSEGINYCAKKYFL